MAKKKNDRQEDADNANTTHINSNTNTNANSAASAKSADSANRSPTGGVDLLELGPDDGQELLEFEGSSHQRATIRVIGVGGGGGGWVSAGRPVRPVPGTAASHAGCLSLPVRYG